MAIGDERYRGYKGLSLRITCIPAWPRKVWVQLLSALKQLAEVLKYDPTSSLSRGCEEIPVSLKQDKEMDAAKWYFRRAAIVAFSFQLILHKALNKDNIHFFMI